ncbi:MAG TPA: dTMP kinase [Blastocatellia bacterium]|nr:dTMP kinase [Blastocatellia bacterium]
MKTGLRDSQRRSELRVFVQFYLCICPPEKGDGIRGIFVTFEGIDGCGKTTQLNRLAEALKARGESVVLTREPGGTPIGQQIRSLLLSKDHIGLDPAAELLLYASDRREHVAKVITPSLERGMIVLCDRYVDSTIAFQGYGRGLDLALIESLNRVATGGLKPELTILLDLEPSLAAERLAARAPASAGVHPKDRLDDEHSDFHIRVRDGYLELAAAEPERIHVIDSSGSPEQSQQKVMAIALPVVKSILETAR